MVDRARYRLDCAASLQLCLDIGRSGDAIIDTVRIPGAWDPFRDWLPPIQCSKRPRPLLTGDNGRCICTKGPDDKFSAPQGPEKEGSDPLIESLSGAFERIGYRPWMCADEVPIQCTDDSLVPIGTKGPEPLRWLPNESAGTLIWHRGVICWEYLPDSLGPCPGSNAETLM